MPLKKKSAIKKTNNLENDPNAEPDTMLSENASVPAGGKKKKKRKKKISKAEKQKAKIEKATDKLRNSGEEFQDFIKRVDQWLLKNSDNVLAFFKQFDEEGDALLSYEEFKSGLFDLNAPINATEAHLLCQLMDIDDTEEIEYMSLSDGLAFIRERELDYEQEDIRPKLPLTKRQLPHCKQCKIALWDGDNFKQDYPRYIRVNLKLTTFENFKTHPGHLHKKIVPSHTTVSSLMEMIRKETQLLSTRLAIYKDNTRDIRSMLPIDYSLEQCGFKGNTIDDPEKVDLFYDYKTEFKDCPLLMCDYYFVKDK